MSATEQRNPLRNRGFILGAIIVGVLVIVALLIAVTSPGGGGGPNTSAATAPPTTPPTPTADSAAASICGLPGYEETNSLASPPAAEWSIAGTVAVPSSAAAGPGTVDEGFRSCFAHTAEGALFSAISFTAMSSDARTRSRISEMVVPGIGRDTAMANTDPNAPIASSRIQLAGYTITAYTADEAVVDLAWTVTTSGGALVSLPVPLAWSEGDWKIQLADSGLPRFSASPLESLGGYTPWSGL